VSLTPIALRHTPDGNPDALRVPMGSSLRELFDDLPMVHIVDVGASPIDGQPPYQRLVETGAARLIGFEPDPDQYQALQNRVKPNTMYLPYAVGDGQDAVLNICYAPGMSSLLEPDMEVLDHFHSFSQWAEVLRRQPVATWKLDDIDQITAMDLLKLDVQGSELAVLQGAARRLEETLVVQTEVQFVPFYKDQPLFADLDQTLRKAGFYLHRFTPLVSRVFKPLLLNNDAYAGLSQVLWSDAIYVRKFTEFESIAAESLLKIALVAHDCYGSVDLAALALGHVDRRVGTRRQTAFLQRLARQRSG